MSAVAELLTLGETMAALSPEEPGPLRYVRGYRARIAGAESNLAIGAVKLGHSAAWASRLGEDEFGKLVLNGIRAEGVDTSLVQFDPRRPTGLMFKEFLGDRTRVHYYRKGSAASALGPDLLPEEALAEVKILHLTGITPVLGESCRAAVDRAFSLAEEKNIPVSFDPNVRQTLWGDRDFAPLLRGYAERADLLLLGREEAQLLFGVGELSGFLPGLLQRGVRAVALKDGARGALVGCREGIFPIPPFPCRPVDPVGAGDAFNAAFLCGVLEGRDFAACGRMGAAAGACAVETAGDLEGLPDRERLWRMLEDRSKPDR